MSLPLLGWNVPAGESGPGLCVVRADHGSGWIYRVGVPDTALTTLDPVHASTMVREVEVGLGSATRPGLMIMEFSTNGERPVGYRAAAAAIHFCARGNSLGNYHDITVSDRANVDHYTLTFLAHLGFREVRPGGPLGANAVSAYATTCNQFPEFHRAQLISSEDSAEAAPS